MAGRKAKKEENPALERDEALAFEIAKCVFSGWVIGQISSYYDISTKDLRRLYPKELEMGTEIVKKEISDSIIDKAKQGNSAQQKLAMQRFQEWAPRTKEEKDTTVTVVVKKMTEGKITPKPVQKIIENAVEAEVKEEFE